MSKNDLPSWANNKVVFWRSSAKGLDYIDASTGEVLAYIEHMGADSWKYEGVHYRTLEAAIKTASADVNAKLEAR
jgi:hypothetical protein